MIKFLQKKIKNKNLTKTEMIIADFFFENQKKLYFLTSTDIANELKISDTSVIRFVKSLGFKSFKDFKKSLKKVVSSKVLTPSERLNLNEELLQTNEIMNIFKNTIYNNIEATLNADSYVNIQESIEILVKSKKKYIVGFKSTSGVASFFGLRLGFVLKDVITFSENSSELIKSIVDINSCDCLCIIAHPKYSKTYSILIELAKKVNAKIIIITDKMTSPVANKGNITILTDIEGISYFNSIVSTQVILEFILTLISKNLNIDSKERLSYINDILNTIK